MATNLFSVGDTIDQESAEFTVVAGTPAGICLKGVTGKARMILKKKDDAGAFQPTNAALTDAAPDGTLVAPGVYKLQRKEGMCGAFRD